MSEQQHEMAAPYVLDALSDEERVLYERHLESCDQCRREVSELQQVVLVLPLAAEQVAPPDSLKSRLLQAVEQGGPESPRLTALPGGARRRRQRPAMGGLIFAAVAAVLVAALGVWNVQLQRTVNDQRAALSFQKSVATQLTRGATVMRVPGTKAAPSAESAIVQPPSGGDAYFIVVGLPRTPVNKVYQLWLVRGNKPRSAKVFRYQGPDPVIVRLPIPASGYPIAAVTVEPGPHGSPSPTGPKVILGPLHAA